MAKESKGWITQIVYLLYIFAVASLVWFIYNDVRKQHERFANEGSNMTPIASGMCMKCMDYFHDVFQFTDPAKVVPYIKERTEYLNFILSQMRDFVENGLGRCPRTGKTLTFQDATACFPKVISDIMNQCVKSTGSRADCTIISRLGDQILAKARECGAKACTVEQFRTRFIQALNVIKNEIDQCQKLFDTPESECSKVYAQVMLAKTKPTAPMSSAGDGNQVGSMSITQDDLRKSSGEAVAFVMTQFA